MANPWILVVQFVLGLGTALFVLWPLWEQDARAQDVFRTVEDEGAVSRRTVIDALGDLEYEHATGKINRQDYRRLRRFYVRRASELLDDEELDAMLSDDTDDELLERAVERARSRLE